MSDDLDADELLAAGCRPSLLARRALADVRAARRDQALAIADSTRPLNAALVEDLRSQP
jgi:hypothetical protein